MKAIGRRIGNGMHTRCTGSPEVSHGLRHRLQTTWATLARWECGASLAEFAVLLPFLTLTLLGVIDMGRRLLPEYRGQ